MGSRGVANTINTSKKLTEDEYNKLLDKNVLELTSEEKDQMYEYIHTKLESEKPSNKYSIIPNKDMEVSLKYAINRAKVKIEQNNYEVTQAIDEASDYHHLRKDEIWTLQNKMATYMEKHYGWGPTKIEELLNTDIPGWNR